MIRSTYRLSSISAGLLGVEHGLVSGREAGNRAYGSLQALAVQFTIVELLFAKSKVNFLSGSFYDLNRFKRRRIPVLQNLSLDFVFEVKIYVCSLKILIERW